MTPKNDLSFTDHIQQAGLSTDQAMIYEWLVRNGSRTAGNLAIVTGYSRPHMYKLLDELIDLGLAVKEKVEGSPVRFSPTHPFALQELIRRKQEELRLVGESVQGIMGSLVSEYTRASQTPGVLISSGLEGIRFMYKDILQTGSDLKLIISVLNRADPELDKIVIENIAKQVNAGIHTKAICASLPAEAIDEVIEVDTKNLSERRVYPRNSFGLPAQIMIYGNKVAIIAYEKELLTTVIENKAIAGAFSIIFDLLWENAQKLK